MKYRLIIYMFIFIYGISVVNGQENDLWDGGEFGGPITYGIQFENKVYFGQGNFLNEATEGTNNFNVSNSYYFLSELSQFKISGDNFYAIYDANSENKNNVTKSTMSDLFSTTSQNYSEISNGINKFEEINGYVLLASNKDGTLSDKLVGKDLLNDSEPTFTYITDFRDFTINGNFAFLIKDNGLLDESIEIIDFSNKSDVKNVGSLSVPFARSLFYSNNYLYVACQNSNGLKVLDVSNPAAVSLAGEYKNGSYSQVMVDGARLLLRKQNRITVLDITDPTSPAYINDAIINDLSSALKITDFKGDKIYYVDNGIFGIINLNLLSTGLKFLSPNSSDWVASDGTTLVVYDKDNYYFHSLENKYSPKAFGVLAATVTPIDFVIEGTTFFVASKNMMQIYDTQDLSNPLSTYNFTGDFSFLKVSKNIIVVGGFMKENGTTTDDYYEIIDISNLSSPTQIYQQANPTLGDITSFALSEDNNTLFMSSENHQEGSANFQLILLTVFDITDKSNPSREKIMELAEGQTTKGKDTQLGIDGTDLFLVTNYLTLNNYYAAKLFAYTVNTPTNPTLISGLQITQSEYNNVAFLEEMLLVTVPADKEIHMYRLDGDETLRKKWTQEKTLPLDATFANMTLMLDEQPTQIAKTANNNYSSKPNGAYGTAYLSQEVEQTKIIKFTKKKKVVATPTKVNLTTIVLPDEAVKDGCKLSGSGEYDLNTVVSLDPTAATGWIPDVYSGFISGALVSTTVKLTQDATINGTFKPILTLGMSSPEPNKHCPPSGFEDDYYIATTNISVDGVDWLLKGITFEAEGKAKNLYTKAYLLIRGKTYFGSITPDGNGDIKTISFVLNEEIKEGTSLPLEFYYRINLPVYSQGLAHTLEIAEALDEVKSLGIKTSIGKLNCDPIQVTSGQKMPESVFISNIQQIANVWNVSVEPQIPFITIQDAIDDVRTLDGNIIEVCDGYYQYEKTIDVTKSLSIIGSSMMKSFIETNDQTVFYANADNITLKNFVMENKKIPQETNIYSAIYIDDGKKNTTIEDSEFRINLRQSGILSANCENLKVANNTFSSLSTVGKQIGVELTNSKSPTIINNLFDLFYISIAFDKTYNGTISDNKSDNSYLDILLEKSDNTKIEKNSFFNGEKCIGLTSSKKCTIDSNYAKGMKLLITNYESNETEIMRNFNSTEGKYVFINAYNSNELKIHHNNNLKLLIKPSRSMQTTGHKIYYNKCRNINLVGITNSFIHHNEVKDSQYHGLNLDNSKYTEIFSNTISNCKRSGFEISSCGEIGIYDNKSFGNEYGIYIFSNVYKEKSNLSVRKNIIKKSRKSGLSIYSFELGYVKITNNRIFDSGSFGVSIIGSRNIYIASNSIFRNFTGIRVDDSKNIRIAINNIFNNWFSSTGVHLENSDAQITGNNITGNSGAGVGLFSDSKATVQGNNIYSNPDYEIKNENQSYTLNADNNFWGSNSLPSQGKLEGNIEVDNWLGKPLSLIVEAEKDTIKTPAGIKDSVTIAFGNYVVPNDLLEINITDEKGWLKNGGLKSISITDTMFSYFELSYQIPNNAGSNYNNKVMITAVSKTNPELTAIDSFYIINYTQKLSAFRISPDSISVFTNDTSQVTATPIDQYQSEFIGEVNLSWSVSAGSIDSNGLFISPPNESVVDITVTDKATGISNSSKLSVLNASTKPDTVIITPDSISTKPERQLQFLAHAIDKNGFNMPSKFEWTTDAGIIDSSGFLIVTDKPGVYSVTAKYIDSDISAHAYIFVKKITTEINKIEPRVPNNYVLLPNYPNPFNPTTVISYQLPVNSFVQISIFNILGENVENLLINKVENSGNHKIEWNASHFSSGVYFLVMRAKSINGNKQFNSVKKMLLIK